MRKEGPTAIIEGVGYSLLPLWANKKRTFENASPLDAGVLAAKSSMFDIVDLLIIL
jgi:hypothetical protein